MATRTLIIDLSKGTGGEPMYGMVTVQRTRATSEGTFEVLPWETKLKLFNGIATITEAVTDGSGPFYDSAYLIRVQNGYCAPRWGFMAALPDGTTPISTGDMPKVNPITGEGIYMDAQEWNALYGDLPNKVSGLEDRVDSIEENSTKRRIIPDGSNIDIFYADTSAGPWYVTGSASAATITGLPDGMGVGSLDVISGPPGHAWTTQLAYPAGQVGPNPRALWRSTVTFNSGLPVWSDWVSYGASSGGAGDPFEPVATGMSNADLLAEAEQRKGGTIGTAGRAGFALRVDHGTNAFRDFLGPLVKKYGIPLTMAVYSKQREESPDKNGVAWPEVESWHHSHGMSYGNHSDDHDDKPDAQGWQGGTVGSLAELKTLMPSVPIEQYIPHGSIGYERYGGFNQANTHEAIVGTLAGRMALSSHALIAGYRGGRYRPLHGKPMQGLTHWSMEESTPAVFKTMLDGAINARRGLAVMFHPEFIGLTGKMTWAQVEECLAYVAQKRDEGVLVPLTLDGLAMADARSDYRDDLLEDPALSLMQDGSRIYGSFTETPGAYTSSTPAAYVRHNASIANRGWALGGTRCAQWNVSSTAGATVTLVAQEFENASPWVATRTITVPVGESVLYLPFGIPLNTVTSQIRLQLTLDSGDITVHETHAYSI